MLVEYGIAAGNSVGVGDFKGSNGGVWVNAFPGDPTTYLVVGTAVAALIYFFAR